MNKDLIKWLLIAAAAYLVYIWFRNSQLGSVQTQLPAGGSGTVIPIDTAGNTVVVPVTGQTPDTVVVPTGSGIPQPGPAYNIYIGEAANGDAAKIQAVAAAGLTYNWWEWNWFKEQVTGSVGAEPGPEVPNSGQDKITINQYRSYLAQKGLAGMFRRPWGS